MSLLLLFAGATGGAAPPDLDDPVVRMTVAGGQNIRLTAVAGPSITLTAVAAPNIRLTVVDPD